MTTNKWHHLAQKEFIASEREAALYYYLPGIKERMEQLSRLQNQQLHFLFPVKSFNHPTILKMAGSLLHGFDVSNQTELEAVRPYLKKDHLVWTSSPLSSNVQTSSSLVCDISCSGHVTGDATGRALRIKPTFLKKENRFGVTPARGKVILQQHPEIRSLHVHLSGIENVLTDYQELVEFYARFTEDLPGSYQLNFGGGFSPLSLAEIQSLVALAQQRLPAHEIFFEPGRWHTEENGLAVGRIVAIEDSYITTTLSSVCHLRWLGTRPTFHLPRRNTNQGEVVTKFYGPTCYENDFLTSIRLPQHSLQENDLLMIDTVSGYSHGWNHSFNGVPKADIVFLGGES